MAQITSISDLMQPPILPNSIPFFDGCDWISITIPNGITCTDVQACIDAAYVCWFIQTGNGIDKVGCTLSINMWYVNANIISDWTYPNITIGNSMYDLSDILDYRTYTISDGGNNTQITQNDTLIIQGIDGMRFFVPITGTDIIQVWLPTARIPSGTRQAGDVLTWTGSVAAWGNACQICCDQIQTCMAPIISGLQSQIDTIVGLIGWGWLTCNTVMDCAGIIDLDNRITDLENANYITCSDLTTTCLEEIQDIVGNMIGSTTGIIVTYDDATGVINYTVNAIPATITVQDEGVDQCADATTINFVGAGVTATCIAWVATVTIPWGAGGYDTIQEEGTPLTQRTVMNFIGTSVTAVDDGINTRTNITVQAYNTIQDEGTPLTQRDTIDFVGDGVVVTDTWVKTQVAINPVYLPIYHDEFDTGQGIVHLSPSLSSTATIFASDIIVANTGTFIISWSIAVNVDNPANGENIFMNILVNGSRILVDEYGETDNIGTNNHISATRTITLNATDTVNLQWTASTNAGGGAQFNMIGQAGQPSAMITVQQVA